MSKRYVLIGDFNFVTTREELVNNPPSQNELQLMRSGCGKIRALEYKARKWVFLGLILTPMLIISVFATWNFLAIGMLIAALGYFGLVMALPRILKLFANVSYQVNGIELVNPMNERLFSVIEDNVEDEANNIDAKKYCQKVKAMQRKATCFDKYVVYMLNDGYDNTGLLSSDKRAA